MTYSYKQAERVRQLFFVAYRVCTFSSCKCRRTDYSICFIVYTPNDQLYLRDGRQDQPLPLLTQSFYSMDRYTVKLVNQELENNNTSIIHTMNYGSKWCVL